MHMTTLLYAMTYAPIRAPTYAPIRAPIHRIVTIHQFIIYPMMNIMISYVDKYMHVNASMNIIARLYIRPFAAVYYGQYVY